MRTTNRVTARMKRVIPFLVVVALLLSPISSLATPAQSPASAPLANKVIFFAADGMRPDLMEKYAGEVLKTILPAHPDRFLYPNTPLPGTTSLMYRCQNPITSPLFPSA